MLQKAIVTTVDYCTRYAMQVIGIAVLLGLVSGIYAASHFAIDADVNKLISKDLPWRQREAAFDKFFPPKEESILAVIDAPTSELASQATAALIQKLSDQKDLFRSIIEAGGGPFFQKNGLLFLPTEQVVEITKKLGEAKPVIQALAQDSNLRGLTTALNYGLIGARMNQYTLDDLSGTLNMVADTLDEVIAGRPASFSWRAMLNGRPPTPSERRRFIEIRPVLDFSCAHAGRGGDRCHPQGGGRPELRLAIWRDAAPHRTGRDRRRGIRHAERGRIRQHHRNDRGRADHPVACPAVAAHHPGGVRQPDRRPLHYRRDRIGAGGRAQPDFGGLRRAVHRPRCRFRHPVQRPLSRRAPRGRRAAVRPCSTRQNTWARR